MIKAFLSNKHQDASLSVVDFHISIHEKPAIIGLIAAAILVKIGHSNQKGTKKAGSALATRRTTFMAQPAVPGGSSDDSPDVLMSSSSGDGLFAPDSLLGPEEQQHQPGQVLPAVAIRNTSASDVSVIMGISLIHFVWGFLSYILYGDCPYLRI